jgi:radical SAM superfamily enzyme YgiQ (UPF0313 family)
MKAKKGQGAPIVLTASRVESSNFGYDPFIAFTSTFPYKFFKPFTNKYLQHEDLDDGQQAFVPYGLRKVEAILVKEFGRDMVKIAHPDTLERFVGKDTKMVGISTMDPMGLAYVSTTYNSLIGIGGEALTSHEFKRMMYNPVLSRFDPTVIVGGAGVWQIEEAKMVDEFGIDCLFKGEAEKDLVPLVKKVLDGEEIPRIFEASKPDYGTVLDILGPGTYGTVEVTRGCGRGCQFCSPTMRRKHSFPIDKIVREVETSVKAGSKMVFINSEDVFLYESKPGFVPNQEAVVGMFKAICDVPGVEDVHLSHASLAPIVYDPKILEEGTPHLLEHTHRTLNGRKFVTVEVGVETGSVRIMKKQMAGKALPYKVDHWPDIVCEGIGNMNDHAWYPLCTFMTGMPDESEDDVQATLELFDRLKDAKMMKVPVLFIPLEEAMLSDAKRIELDRLSESQWDVILTAWQHNTKIWQSNKEVFIRPLFFLTQCFYVRWRHGPKTRRPMLKMMGLDGTIFDRKVARSCDKPYCASGGRMKVAIDDKADATDDNAFLKDWASAKAEVDLKFKGPEAAPPTASQSRRSKVKGTARVKANGNGGNRKSK